MKTQISVAEKRSFIEWFLRHYQLKKRESHWIFSYLIQEDELLESIHFVRDIALCPRAIVMSTTCSLEEDFSFYKGHMKTNDPEKAFHDMRLNNGEALYIQLNFMNAKQNPDYAIVLEDNPYSIIEPITIAKDQLIAKEILSKSIKTHQKELIKLKIDEALDQLDEELFKTLTDQLNKL